MFLFLDPKHQKLKTFVYIFGLAEKSHQVDRENWENEKKSTKQNKSESQN